MKPRDITDLFVSIPLDVVIDSANGRPVSDEAIEKLAIIRNASTNVIDELITAISIFSKSITEDVTSDEAITVGLHIDSIANQLRHVIYLQQESTEIIARSSSDKTRLKVFS